jgi:phosphatidylinositol-3-phosphatase
MAIFFAVRPVMRYSVLGLLAVSMLFALTINVSATSSHLAFAQTQAALPHFDHIVVAVEENHSYAQVIGSGNAPYINSLVSQGALFTDSHAVSHPSEPNYLALFAGSTFGISSDACPEHLAQPDLGGELLGNGDSFAGYSESMPSAGFTGCSFPGSALYARKHNPWASFSDVAGKKTNKPFSSFPGTFSDLPTVSFVVPNQLDDMHSGSISAADSWLKNHLGNYVQWAKAHNSLFILTWDEDNGTSANHIATIFVGAHVRIGHYNESIDHYNVLRTIEAIYGLAFTRNAANVATITDVWK